jgi:hypothetical protein
MPPASLATWLSAAAVVLLAADVYVRVAQPAAVLPAQAALRHEVPAAAAALPVTAGRAPTCPPQLAACPSQPAACPVCPPQPACPSPPPQPACPPPPPPSVCPSPPPRQPPPPLAPARPAVALPGPAVRGVVPPAPRTLPACTAASPGIWRGERRPFTWVPSPPCAFPLAGAYDLLARFASMRILVIGDSTSRNFARDLLRLLLGCAEYPALSYAVEHWHGTGLGAQSPADAAKCDELAALDRGDYVDFNASVPVGGTGEFVELRFHWLAWPDQLASAWWWNATVMSGDFDVALVNFYLHLVSWPGGARPGTYAGWLDTFTAALGRAPSPAVAAKLRRRLFWRTTFPGEWWHPHYPPFHRNAVVNASALAAATLRRAGYRVLDGGDKYVAHESCTVAGPSATVGCATADGDHATTPVNLAMARELLGTVAAHLEDDAAADATAAAAVAAVGGSGGGG